MGLTRIRIAIFLSLIGSAFIARPSRAQTLEWHQTNGPYGGNISALAANTSTIFAGLKYGGVYRSTNQGDFWMRADSGMPRLPIYALAASGPVVFAGTDSGIYRSTDDGLSWARMNTALHGWEIRSLAASGALAIAGTQDSKIFVSMDSGLMWNRTLNLGDTLQDYAGIAVIRKIGSVLVAGTYVGPDTLGSIWRSVDSGRTWALPTIGIPHPYETVDITLSGSDLYAMCNGSGLYRSTDTGNTWSAIDTAKDFQGGNAIAALGSVLLADVLNHHDVYRSTDVGQTWATVPALQTPELWEFTTQDSIIFAGTAGGIFRSRDSGATWLEVDSGIIASYVDAFAVDSQMFYSGSYGGGFYQFSGTDTAWIRKGMALPNAYVLSTAKLGSDLYAGTAYGDLYTLRAGSPNWAIVSALGCDSSFDFVYCLATDSISIFAGVNCGIERSIDSGRNWEILDSASDTYSLLASGSLIIAGVVNGVVMSADNGNSWSFSELPRYDTRVNAVAINEGAIFAAFLEMERSTDGGASWVVVDTGLYGRPYALAANGATIFAGTQFGVYLSTNNGDSWIAENSGLNDVPVYALAVKGNKLFAGTRTGGVYETDISSLPSSVTTPVAAANSIELSLTPNPVSSEATFRFTIAEPEPVSISVFDPLGREVWSEHRDFPAGMQDVPLDVRSLPTAAYFYQIRLGNETKSGVMIVNR